jgi:hypothetical protein
MKGYKYSVIKSSSDVLGNIGSMVKHTALYILKSDRI